MVLDGGLTGGSPLTNTLTSKTRKEGSFEITRISDKDKATVIDSATDYSYNDFLRFLICSISEAKRSHLLITKISDFRNCD